MDKGSLRNGMGISFLSADSKRGSAPQVAQRPLDKNVVTHNIARLAA